MVTESVYASFLNNQGQNLSEVRKNNSSMIMNATFTGDPSYKRVFILDPYEGWHWTDAKFHQHSRQSILADDVDYYLQFRPKEHHMIGVYVFIPNEESNDVGFMHENPVNPFKDENFQDIFDDGKLWLIVGKNNSNQFVRYMCLQCDWLFKWVADYQGKKKLFQCYGVSRSQSDYTSGRWAADFMYQLDTVTSFWLPDTYWLYGEDISKYELEDTRYLPRDTRLMFTTNIIYPQCYMVTKIKSINPQGVLKLTVKEDEYNEKKDEPSLFICDYYNDSGDVTIQETKTVKFDRYKTSQIYWQIIDKDTAELRNYTDEEIENGEQILHLGEDSYFMVEFSDSDIFSEWRITYSESNTDYSSIPDIGEQSKEYLAGLLVITKHNETVISIRPSKAKSLIGKKFTLTVQDSAGNYKSSIEMEVAE